MHAGSSLRCYIYFYLFLYFYLLLFYSQCLNSLFNISALGPLAKYEKL